MLRNAAFHPVPSATKLRVSKKDVHSLHGGIRIRRRHALILEMECREARESFEERVGSLSSEPAQEAVGRVKPRVVEMRVHKKTDVLQTETTDYKVSDYAEVASSVAD